MRGFDAANKIVGESVGVHGCAIADDPVLQRLSLCVDDLLPALSRACRVYGDGAAMHAMIALTASMAREDGLEESIAEAFRVNAAMLDNRPLRHMPGPGINSTMPFHLKKLAEWFQQRLNQFLAADGLKHQAIMSASPRADSSHEDEKKSMIQDSGLAAQGAHSAAAQQ